MKSTHLDKAESAVSQFIRELESRGGPSLWTTGPHYPRKKALNNARVALLAIQSAVSALVLIPEEAPDDSTRPAKKRP